MNYISFVQDGKRTESLTPKTKQYFKTYKDFNQWWHKDAQCFMPDKNAQYYHWTRGCVQIYLPFITGDEWLPY